MTTLDNWIDRNFARYAPDASVHRDSPYWQLRQLKGIEARLVRLDPLGTVRVVGAHLCRGHHLHVVRIDLPRRGIKIFARDNFHSWSVSVESETPLLRLAVANMSLRIAESFSFCRMKNPPTGGGRGLSGCRASPGCIPRAGRPGW